MKEYELFELENGIRVIHRQMPGTKIAHVGIMLDIGSRDELPEEQGIAHFWEHMAFKGTSKRKAYHILNRLDSLGGELNAYTTKEKICFYASVLDNHLDKAVELLTDITFNATFPESQIEKERMVILEEMAMYRDTPDDAIQDDFDELIFKNHALGKNILGTEESVNSFRKSNFVSFLNRNLNTERILVSSVGSYPSKKLTRVVEKYISQLPYKNHTPKRSLFHDFVPQDQVTKKPISQAHVAIGSTSFGIRDPKRIPFFMLVNILGGPGMNSRLNLSLREKYGFVYGIDASYTPYLETGLFGIYFATDPRNLEKSMRIIKRELDLLRTKPLGQLQLHQAKQQLKGQLAMSEENNSAIMLMMAKSMLDLNRVPNLNDLFDQIDKVDAQMLMNLANESFDIDKMSMLTFQPET